MKIIQFTWKMLMVYAPLFVTVLIITALWYGLPLDGVELFMAIFLIVSGNIQLLETHFKENKKV